MLIKIPAGAERVWKVVLWAFGPASPPVGKETFITG